MIIEDWKQLPRLRKNKHIKRKRRERWAKKRGGGEGDGGEKQEKGSDKRMMRRNVKGENESEERKREIF